MVWGVLALMAALANVHSAAALTPKSPEVEAAVKRGIKFLESGSATDSRLGARALVGLAMLKSGQPLDHPEIVKAIAAIQRAVASGDIKQLPAGDDSIYSLGIAAIFLLEFNPIKYEKEIQLLLDYLWMRQKQHGGWGYVQLKTGDTSMTQYAVLCAWEADQLGFKVPPENIDRVAVWLLKTQDPSGAFGYQGLMSDLFTPTPQSSVNHSMTAAGLGSLYVCADLLKLTAPIKDPNDDVSSALRRVETPAAGGPASEAVKISFNPKLLRAAQARGMGWMGKNYRVDPPHYTLYYMYALERCMTFRELAEGRMSRSLKGDGPKWYNDGARYLMKKQLTNGSWKDDCQPTADTCFAILFLLRSTLATVGKLRPYGDGLLVGGRGLPKDTERAYLKDGEMVVRPLMGPAEQLMKILSEQEEPDWDALATAVVEAPSQDAVSAVEKHLERFRELVADESPIARLAAVRALARSRNLDNVPVLIYALSDPDPGVLREARDALRRISRKPLGFGMPEKPSDADRIEATVKWRDWYKGFRPDAEFDDD